MDDLTQVIQAKSDQLNSDDLFAGVKRLKITKVIVNSTGTQDHIIYYEGGEKRPYKPSKGMSRIMAKYWGIKPSLHVGKVLEVFREPTVVYAGKQVGGIEISGMSDLPSKTVVEKVAITRGKFKMLTIKNIEIEGEENSGIEITDNEFNNFVVMINNAEDEDKLLFIAGKIKEGGFNEDSTNKLKKEYARRKKELSNPTEEEMPI